MSSTKTLAEFAVDAQTASLPDWAFHEAKRTLINMLSISLSASHAKPVDILLEWTKEEGAAARATVIGRGLRTSIANAAMLNGYLAHLQDYDDTHFPTILHPTAPVWPAVLAMAEDRRTSGRETLAAFVLGAEAACRVAL
ncbi:MAG: MmgE/PrpD family protein, partial [Dehalococcoidia bacterium]